MDKLIISVATTGSWTTRQHTPHVPLTEAEIAQQVVASWRVGAAIAHIHVRDERGIITCDPARYHEVRRLVRAAGCDIILNFSTGGGAGQTTDEERLAPVACGPEIASFDAGSTNFGARVFINSPDFLTRLAAEMRRFGVKPEIECFDAGMIATALRMADEGLLDRPLFFQFVLGIRGAAPATVAQLAFMVSQLPLGSPWSVCAVGRHQLPMNTAAIVMGGHARTGLEDNVYYRRGVLAAGNAHLVARLARLARELGRDVASPAEARHLLGLTPLLPEEARPAAAPRSGT
jgi:3-keto-5-aminohexanoate cleavage enzyme